MYFQLLKALNYNSTVLDQDADHEVGGLRPVHMYVCKGTDTTSQNPPDGVSRRSTSPIALQSNNLSIG
jgi:hypothetical protein